MSGQNLAGVILESGRMTCEFEQIFWMPAQKQKECRC